MKLLSLALVPLLVVGCATRQKYESYPAKPNDPLVFVQSTVEMGGTARHLSGTYFSAKYPNDANECETLFTTKLEDPISQEQLLADIESGHGWHAPAGRRLAVTVSHSRTYGGSFLRTERCPATLLGMIPEAGGKYLVQFSLIGNSCIAETFDVRDPRNPKRIDPMEPGSLACVKKQGTIVLP